MPRGGEEGGREGVGRAGGGRRRRNWRRSYLRVLGSEVGDDVGNHGIEVIGMRLDGGLGEFMKVFGREDIPPVLFGCGCWRLR